MNFLKSFWHNYITPSKPWVDLGLAGDKVIVKGFNKSFVEQQRVKLGDLSDGRTDEQIAQLFVDRDSLRREVVPPRLDVIHLGIETDGRVKVKLDWNSEFIQHLAENGITGETDDEAIQNYLQILTHDHAVHDPELFSKDQLKAAFEEIDNTTRDELDAAKKQSMTKSRRRIFK